MKPIHSLPLFATALLLAACGGSKYTTDFPPPTGDEKYSEIFPSEIGGEPLVVEGLDLDADRYSGAVGRYGSGASILLLQAKDQDALDSYVKEVEVPTLDSYNSRVSGKFNGVWSFRAKGASGRVQGWQNRQWFFVIRTDGDERFEEIVEKFPYIGRK